MGVQGDKGKVGRPWPKGQWTRTLATTQPSSAQGEARDLGATKIMQPDNKN
jgi:hypothetical protein